MSGSHSIIGPILRIVRRRIRRITIIRRGGKVYRVVVRRRRRKPIKYSRNQYIKYKETARGLVHTRLEYFIEQYRLVGVDFKPVGKIFIKNTLTRWGSCSSKGNLNFSYRLANLPAYLSDYIIVHELCHLKEFNHSKAFWDLVEKMSPDYAKYRNELKGHSL